MAGAGGLEDLISAASAVVGTRVKLLDDLSFSSRAAVARIDAGEGRTAIAKKPFSLSAFAAELEALQILPADTRPALLGSADGVLVMEDLGTGPSLADVLLSPSGDRAERALASWAGTLGRALRATLRNGTPTGRLELGDGLAELRALADELAVPVPAGVEDDVRHIAGTLSHESPWLAYCPGDTCPDNNRVLADGSVRLFDFEGSGWRHAATEAAYCRAPFCTCWCVSALPAGVLRSMEAEFLGALDPPTPEEFRATVGLAAVSWTLTTFDHFRRFVHEGRAVGPPVRAPIGGRQYVVLRLEAVGAQREELPALAELACALRAAIVRRWPEAATLPVYPAFREHPRAPGATP